MSKRRGKAETESAAESAARTRKDEAWDDRLRRVGDANYVAVDWSTRDPPYWPLPSD
ncbi:MAG TPA: hypothetical protein VMR17_00990 [Xanthobacteraceae bacterium]|jgi:hypothetical protein|nr:hypothetical protein [Xanthobacteraceae bacterium]